MTENQGNRLMATPGQSGASAGEVLRSLAFYVLFYAGTVLLGVMVSLRVMLPGQGFTHTVHAWTGWHRWCVRHVLGIELRIEGPVPEGAVLVAMKHESFFEAIDMPVLLDFPAIFAKAELLRLPLWGAAGRRYGLIGVERDQGAKALRTMIGEARRLTAEGRVLAIFPEGTRVPHGTVRPLQAGFAGVYKLLGLPVVPAAVDSGALYQRRWKRRGTITYRFGAMIPAGLPREEIEARVSAAINELNPGALA